MTRRFFAITLFAALAATAGAAAANDFSDHFVFAKPSIALPMFTFQDAKGQELDLTNFRGHYVLLNIWATWCGPCAHEMPALDKLAQKIEAENAKPDVKDIAFTLGAPAAGAMFSPKMDIIPLAEDRDGLAAAETFYKRHNLQHLKVFIDEAGEAPSILQINGLPTTFLIDPNGYEIGRIEGATDWDSPATLDFLEAQMKPAAK
jgi:thiol-disulfide isomerase/thioredoxin